MKKEKDFSLSCPIGPADYPHILLAHGGGGKLMHQLLEKIFIPAFKNPYLEMRHDAAVLPLGEKRFAFTTDSYVVQPLFFPGGDIGSLAVNGTLNDLAMCGARPLYLSSAFILEEGLPMETLRDVVESMRQAAETAGVQLVTGDTKVVDKGKGDGLFVNTAGIGILEHDMVIAPQSVCAGDSILVSGDIGRHGMAIMAQRKGLTFESSIQSDSAAVWPLVHSLLSAGIRIHCLRDLTRGGLANALVEIAGSARKKIVVDEKAIPVSEEVKGSCEILGFDPLYVANEGRFVAFVAPAAAQAALKIMRSNPLGAQAALIGTVTNENSDLVVLKSLLGTSRNLDMLTGEQLPRIC